MFIIPNPFQIILDDMGWFCGSDDRPAGGASRTAMPRCHVEADYEVINYIGEQVGMKINCAFIIGEWDPDNRLRAIPHLSKYGDKWDNASHLDIERAKRCAEILNNSPYIDLCLHGLNHGYYMEGVDNWDTSDYFYRIDGKLYIIPEKEIRARLDAFFGILDYYGIKKKVNSFVTPSGDYRWNEISYILKEYGIEYQTGLDWMQDGCADKVAAFEESGVLFGARATNILPWFEVDSDLSNLPADGMERDEDGNPKYGVFGIHWPNMLNRNPKENHITGDKWIKYIKNVDEQFESFISPDVGYACHQLLYLRYAKWEVSDDCITIDLENVPSDRSFRVNVRADIKGVEGCEMKPMRDHDGFTNYEITPKSKKIVLHI